MSSVRVGQTGDAVRRLQRALNARAVSRNLDTVIVDGEMGPATLAAAVDAGRALGALESTLRGARSSGVVPAWLVSMIVDPGSRTAAQLRRARERKDAEPPRSGVLRERAYAEASKLVGVMEVGGNNRGAKVSEIIRANGGSGPEPWCGDFAAYCYRRAGSRAPDRRWAYVPYLSAAVGVRRTYKPERGDLVQFEFTGDSTPDHVAFFVRDNGDGTITTIEGNTGRSGAVSDSRTGGDGVYIKVRSKSLVKNYLRVTR